MVKLKIHTPRRALFIGRFQPFHNGHLNAIKSICRHRMIKEIIIAIGSAQSSNTKENPFSTKERIEMVNSVLKGELKKIKSKIKFHIIPVDDVDSDQSWVSNVERVCPRFDVVYTNNNLTRRLFSNVGYKISRPELTLYKNQVLSATTIRRMIARSGKKNEDKWINLLPQSVYKKILKSGGVERIKKLQTKT